MIRNSDDFEWLIFIGFKNLVILLQKIISVNLINTLNSHQQKSNTTISNSLKLKPYFKLKINSNRNYAKLSFSDLSHSNETVKVKVMKMESNLIKVSLFTFYVTSIRYFKKLKSRAYTLFTCGKLSFYKQATRAHTFTLPTDKAVFFL